MAAMLTGGRLASKMDPRWLMAAGIFALAWSMWEMTGWTPDVAQWKIITTIIAQGAGLGFVFLPLQVLAFSTLPPTFRTDGASLFSLFRNIGAAVGVSVTSSLLAHNTQVLHEQIGAYVTPFNRALQGGDAVSRMWNPMHAHGAAMLDRMVNEQAQIIAYINDYRMMVFTTLSSLALLFLMRRPKLNSAAPPDAAHAALD
jgi:MFS transporter, DHA2 family, multidrug resistance protein